MSCKSIDREYMLDCIYQWGNHCSIAFLDPSCQFFHHPDMEGIIGYHTRAHTAVMFGDPACPQEQSMQLMQAFYDHCKQKNKRICCIGASAPFTKQLLEQQLCRTALAIGNEIMLQTAVDPKSHRGGDGSSLRNKWLYSIRRGLAVQEYTQHDPVLEQQFEQLRQQWHAHRKGPQIYLAQTDIFTHRKHRRWFYATYQDEVVGLLLLTQLHAQQGFVINVLFLAPQAPTTTSEFIILSTLQQLSQEGLYMLSAGFIPKIKIDTMYGVNGFWQWVIHKVYAQAHQRYQLHRKDQYWRKFAPLKKELFVLFEHQRVRTSDIMSILRALHAF